MHLCVLSSCAVAQKIDNLNLCNRVVKIFNSQMLQYQWQPSWQSTQKCKSLQNLDRNRELTLCLQRRWRQKLQSRCLDTQSWCLYVHLQNRSALCHLSTFSNVNINTDTFSKGIIFMYLILLTQNVCSLWQFAKFCIMSISTHTIFISISRYTYSGHIWYKSNRQCNWICIIAFPGMMCVCVLRKYVWQINSESVNLCHVSTRLDNHVMFSMLEE